LELICHKDYVLKEYEMQFFASLFKCTKVLMRTLIIIMIMGCFLSFIGVTEGKTTSTKLSKETERWLAECEDYLKENDAFYLYAVRLFKAPIRRVGEITQKDGEYIFGTRQFFFAGGCELRIESFPPESGVSRLIVPKGFPNEKEALAVLKKDAEHTGAKLNWLKPVEKREGKMREVEYTTDDEDNIFARLKYKNGKLVELWFSMAL
jgi:hypothetical protein